MKKISKHTIQRLILYKKIIKDLIRSGATHIYSHKLGLLADSSPAQVRRDMMSVGFTGTPAKGYDLIKLEKSITDFLFKSESEKVVLVGLGHLGRAILNYCDGIDSPIKILASFDIKPDIIGRIIHKVKCYDFKELGQYIKTNKIKVGIITSSTEAAQEIAEVMINSGINSILNFTPEKLKVPQNIFVENLDMMMSLEKAAYFANLNK